MPAVNKKDKTMQMHVYDYKVSQKKCGPFFKLL